MQTGHFAKLERMYQNAPCNQYYRPRLLIGPEGTELAMDIRPEFFHSAGAAHGSVCFKALDDAAFFAVAALVEDVFVLTHSFSTYLIRPVKQGPVVCRGRVISPGERLILAESELFDQRGRLLARGQGTFVRSQMELGPELGYL